MAGEKKLIRVVASFAHGQALFDEISKYAHARDEQWAYWDEFAFTTRDIAQADGLLVFNHPGRELSLCCDPAAVIAFMMEPGIRRKHPWMFRRLDQYAAVYSPVRNSPNTVVSHGYLGWYGSHDWNFYHQLPVPQKTRSFSCIASSLTQLRGHRLRIQFIDQLQREMTGIDFFGKGSQYLPDKLDGLLPYRFSIAIENTTIPDYFTEKINDCFLAYTVPVYHGCTNLEKYFPEGSFIRIDIHNPARAIATIRDAMENDDWEKRLNAVKEARSLVLDHYQPLAGAAQIFRGLPYSGKGEQVQLRTVPESISRKVRKLFYLKKQQP